MSSKQGAAPITIVDLWHRLDTALLVGLGDVLAVSSVFAWARHAPVAAVVAYLAVVAAASVWLLARGWRLGVRFDERGLTVRKFLKTYRFGWPEVSHFADGSTLAGEGQAGWALAVVLRDERVITTRLAGLAGAGSPKRLAAVRQAADRYQVPAELTGQAALRGGSRRWRPGHYADPESTRNDHDQDPDR
jgi:hypothetical protein